MSDDYPLPLEDWRTEAVCKGHLDLFFRDERGPIAPDHPALMMCRRCPVRSQCLDDALKFGEFDDHGIRAGLTPAQRHKLRSGKPMRRHARHDILDALAGGEWWIVATLADEVRRTVHHVRQELQRMVKEGLVHAERDPTWVGMGSPRIRYCDPLALREEVAS
jgi:hypothetical protein